MKKRTMKFLYSVAAALFLLLTAALPAEAAQSIADCLVAAGIRGIWNFAPVKLQVPPGIAFVSEDLSVGLSSLSYYLTHTTGEGDNLSERIKETLIK